MTNNHVTTYLMGNYKINQVMVEIYFAPKVIEVYASKDEICHIISLLPGEEYDVHPLEMHFKNIFEIVKSRVLEFKTYEIFFNNIEYEGHQLIWKSNFDEKSKLMKIGVKYAEMNNLEYDDELDRAFQEWWDAVSIGEEMDELIKRQFEAGKDHPNKPILDGFIPRPSGTSD